MFYWHSYLLISIGTADSTVPSPVPLPHRKPHPVSSEYETHIGTDSPNPLPVPARLPHDDLREEVLPIPISAIPRRPDVHAKWGGASPRTLAHLLSTVSSRPSPSSTPASDSRPMSDYDVSSPPMEIDFGHGLDAPLTLVDLSDTELQLESLSGQGTLFEQEPFELDTRRVPPSTSPKMNSSAVPRIYDANRVGGSYVNEVDTDGEVALRESLQGVWRLWKATRRRQTTVRGEDERERFLQVVQDVIGRA